ncbi:MAG: sulfotransferase [Panacagrimonas sp.]
MKLLQRLRSALFYDYGDIRGSVFLAGSGRSGTTWVEEVLNHDNEYRVLFEPFHSRKIGRLREWKYRQYLRGGESDEKFVAPAKAILSGRIRHRWIDRFNRKLLVRKRLIKDIRAHLILNWIKQQFPAIPLILLLRHPCAVASSKMKLGWETHLDDFLGQADLVLDHLEPFRREIAGAKDVFDQHIFMWCIENYVPLKQFSAGEVLVVFYEDICTRPAEQIARIFSFIGKGTGGDLARIAGKPSALSRKDSAIQSGADLIGSWKKSVSPEQARRAVEILKLFGLDAVYGTNPAPLLDGEAALRLFQESGPERQT